MPKLSTRPNRFYPSIPGVTEDQSTHTNALQQIRESIETHERRNSNYLKSFIRFEELVELGIIDETGEFILDTGGDSGTGVNVLDDLEDVTTGGPADNDILGYDFATGQWTAQNAAELNLATLDDLSGVSGVQYLADLLDVDVTGGSQYDLLYLNGLWRPTNGVMQWSGTDLHIDGGGVYFAQVGQTQNAYVAANVSAVGNLDLQALGDVFLTPDRDVRVDEADVVLDRNQGIRFVHSDLAKRYHLELAGGPPEGVTQDPLLGQVTLLVTAENGAHLDGAFTSDIGGITWTYTGGDPIGGAERGHLSNVSAYSGELSVYAKGETGATFTGLVGPAANSTEAEVFFPFDTDGLGEWTFEFWIDPSTEYTGLNPDGRWGNSFPVLSSFNDQANSAQSIRLQVETDGDLSVIMPTAAGRAVILSQIANGLGSLPSTWMNETWTHWAIVRQSDGEVRAYCNGFLRARTGTGLVTSIASTAFFQPSNIQTVNFGCNQRNSQVPNSTGSAAYIDDFRITQGARYTESGASIGDQIFDPPTGLPDTGSTEEQLFVGDPGYPTEIDGTRVSLKNAIGITWDDLAGADIEGAVFASTTAPGVTPDPDIGSVTFLAGFEGATAGAETFTADIDTNNVGAITWAITSGTQPTQVDAEISTAQAKYGTQSIYAKESAGAPAAAWSSGSIPGSYFSFTGDFTIECDIYIVDGTSEIPICGSWVFGEYQWKWTLEGGNQRMGFLFGLTDTTSSSGGTQEAWGGASQGVPTGAWHHIAVCRSGDQWYFWLDGALSDGGANTNANAINIPTTTNFNIMADGPALGAGQIEAYIDNLRITDGVARYTTAFTPPTAEHDTGGAETFVFGDPAYATQIDGLTTTVTGDAAVSGATQLDTTLNVDGVSDFNDTVNINTGNSLVLHNELDNRSVSMDMASTNLFFRADGTGQNLVLDDWSLVSVRSGAQLRIYDGTDGDYGVFTHDGTDFNLDFVNTTDWNVTGATGTYSFDNDITITSAAPKLIINDTDSGVDEKNWIVRQNGGTFRVQTATDAAPSTGVETAFQMNRSGTAATAAQFNLDNLTVNANADAQTQFTIGETTTLRGDSQDSVIRMYAEQTGAIDNASITYNGTNWTFNSSGIIDFASATNVRIRDGAILEIRDASDTDYITLSHDGTNATFAGVGTGLLLFNGMSQVNFTQGTDVWIRDGAYLRLSDSLDTDWAEFSHDGTDFNTAFTNTTDWNITGLSGSFNLGPDATQPWLTLDAISTGDNWDDQGAGISIGEAGAKNSGFHLTYNNGVCRIGSGSVDDTTTTGGTPSQGHIDFSTVGDTIRMYGGVEVRDGPTSGYFRIYGPAGTNYVTMDHDNTTLSSAFTNTREWAISGLSLDDATGNETAMSLAYTVNKATSGDDTGFLINKTDTLSQGVSRLIDVQVGGVTQFNVQDDGVTNLGNFSFDTDQTVGVGQDDYVLTYDNGTGLISLEAAAGGPAAGTVTDSMLRWSGTDWVEEDRLRLSDAGVVTILDSTLADSVTFDHDGLDFNITASANTSELNFVNWDSIRMQDGLGTDLYVGMTSPTIQGVRIGATQTGTDRGQLIALGDRVEVSGSDWTFSTSGNSYEWLFATNATPKDVGAEANYAYFGTDNTAVKFGLRGMTGGANPYWFDMRHDEGVATTSTDRGWRWKDGNIEWMRFNVDLREVDLFGGTLLRIRNSLNGDWAEFSHDGTDFNTAFTNTTDWNINGITNADFESGAALRLYDSGNLGSISISKTSQFDVDFTQTETAGTFSFTGAQYFELNHGTTGNTWLRIGEQSLNGGSSSSYLEMAGENSGGTTKYIARFNQASSGGFVLANVSNVTNFTISMDTIIPNGNSLFIRNGADEAEFRHDGTDFNTAFATTTDWNITGLAGFNVVNYSFDVDQTVGAGQDNYVLTYDDASGLISLEAGGGGPAAGTVTNSILRWDGAAWSETTQFLATPSSNEFAIRGTLAGAAEVKALSFQDSGGTEYASMETQGTGAFIIQNLSQDDSFELRGTYTGGSQQTFLSWNPNSHTNLKSPSGRDLQLYAGEVLGIKIDNLGVVDFYYSGTSIAQIASEAGGGLTVKQTETGETGVFSRVQVQYDLGADGEFWFWDFSTGMSDPTQSRFRFNNATLSSVTQIAVDDLTISGRDFGGVLAEIQTGTRIKISQTTDLTIWAIYEVTGAPTDNTGWWQIPVQYVDHNGTFPGASRPPMKWTFENLASSARGYDVKSSSFTPTGTTQTLNFDEGPAFEVDLESVTGDVTITLAGDPPSGMYGEFVIKVTQDSATARTITWAGGTFNWDGGTAHPMNSTLDGFSIFRFETWDGGTTYWGRGADYS